MVSNTKKCPFCAEDIKKEAVKCKHCGSDIKEQEKQKEYEKKTGLNTEISMSIVTKWVLYIGGFVVAIVYWYISIPLITIWFVWKKLKWQKKKKLIISLGIFILSIIFWSFLSSYWEAPDISILEPENNYSTQFDKVEIKGTVKPKHSKIQFSNSIELDVKNGNFSYFAKLNNKINTFSFVATNHGQKDTKKIVINRIFSEEELAKKERKEKENLIEHEKIEKEKAINKLENKKIALQREIKSIIDFNSNAYRGSIDNLTIEIALFKTWTLLIKDAKNDEDVDIKKLGQQLEDKIKQLQIKEFPLMRKEYGNLVAKKLWEHDIDVKVFGGSNNTIEFIGGLFAANKNVKDTHGTLVEMLRLLRFDRANYKWYKYDSEYTYYTIKSNKDNEIVS